MSTEPGAVALLAADGVAGLARRAEELHQAIADRAFRTPASAPARALHDAIAATAYASVRGASRAAGAVAAATLPERELTAGPRGAAVQSALNGWMGDRLAANASPLAVTTAIRAHGRDLELTPAAIANAFPDATGRIVVFTHGLGESEAAWRLRATARGATYATTLHDQLATTAVFVRANTGLPIAANGARLAQLLDALVAGWPVEVERIDLVGHSMGGLIGRAACTAGGAWLDHLQVTVTLGTPHHGAPLEQAAQHAVELLDLVPEAAPVARVIDTRSVGIKDLRHGLATERHGEARHYAVAATITQQPRHLLARLVGDALVLLPSAHGGLADDAIAHVGGIDHLALLNDPRVEERLLAWLA
jgi:pimeloyl-ACP methyl ester carboxylesterase